MNLDDYCKDDLIELYKDLQNYSVVNEVFWDEAINFVANDSELIKESITRGNLSKLDKINLIEFILKTLY